MKRELIITEDGSNSIFIPEMDETYHSTHGALQEAKHVFIENGLNLVDSESIKILEMGFGTGLNAFLTAVNAEQLMKKVDYIGVEAFPVEQTMIDSLNYSELIGEGFHSVFTRIHKAEWEVSEVISSSFSIQKVESKIQDYNITLDSLDVVFFDAFGPRVQSELWTEAVLGKMYSGLKQDGFLVTYCAQGQFKRNLKSVGFEVECVPGPPGKREMTLAFKR